MPHHAQGEVYHAKERCVDLAAELAHVQEQLAAAAAAESERRAAVDGAARAAREAAEAKRLYTQLFKQVGESAQRRATRSQAFDIPERLKAFKASVHGFEPSTTRTWFQGSITRLNCCKPSTMCSGFEASNSQCMGNGLKD
eukprot:16610-Chlamydomonas_euryale.AAC.5